MSGAPQVAMRIASQIWQIFFASQTLQIFCLALCKKAQYVVVPMGRFLIIHTFAIKSPSFFSPLIHEKKKKEKTSLNICVYVYIKFTLKIFHENNINVKKKFTLKQLMTKRWA
jgi:hypothetical protein